MAVDARPHGYALQSTGQIGKLLKEYRAQCQRAKAEKSALIEWNFAVAMPEIVRSFNILPMTVEVDSAQLAAKGHIVKYLEHAEGRGYSRDACTLHRACIGHSLAKEHPYNVPDPDLLVACNSCDSQLKGTFPLAEAFGVPYHIVDLPWNVKVAGDQDLEEHAVEYMMAELRELISFLEGLTGTKLDPAALRHRVELARRLYELWGEIYKLSTAVPCPFGGRDEAAATLAMMQMSGTEEAVAYYESIARELRERVAKKQGVLEDEEYRILWVGPSISYDTGLFSFFEERNAVIVKTELDFLYSGCQRGYLDPDKPIESLARKQTANLYNGIMENRLNLIKTMVDDFQVDGVVYMCAWFCRLLGGGQRAIKEAAYKQFGVPTLVIDVDNLDPRSYTPDQVRNRIEDFLEMLD